MPPKKVTSPSGNGPHDGDKWLANHEEDSKILNEAYEFYLKQIECK